MFSVAVLRRRLGSLLETGALSCVYAYANLHSVWLSGKEEGLIPQSAGISIMLNRCFSTTSDALDFKSQTNPCELP